MATASVGGAARWVLLSAVAIGAVLSLATDDSVVELHSQSALPSPAKQPAPADSDAFKCQHCGASSLCRKQYCKQDSPLFEDASVQVPPNAGKQWHCDHCRAACKTSVCNSWCKKFWCPVDADGNAVQNAKPMTTTTTTSSTRSTQQPLKFHKMTQGGDMGIQEQPAEPPAPKIKTASKPMDLLSITTTGSPMLQEMERKANAIITQSNKDTTGKMLRAAGHAIDAVLKQREHEASQFKEVEQKSNERDKKRYSKKMYRKWSNEKEAQEGIRSADMLVNAKEKTSKDKTKEVKFKAQSDEESAATADTDAVIEKETSKFEKEEAVATATKAAGVFDMDKDHAKKMKQNPGQPVYHLKNKATKPEDNEGDESPDA